MEALIDLGILLVNSNCFAIFLSSILVMSVQISIYNECDSLYGSPKSMSPMC